MTVDVAPHPAKWSEAVLDAIGSAWFEVAPPVAARVLDPFAGVGIARLRAALGGDEEADVVGVELEAEWCPDEPGMVRANTLRLPFRTHGFDAVITSPCVGVDEQVLTADLRWVRAGDVGEGDRLLAFDEFPVAGPGMTRAQRRRWRIATVEQAGIAPKACVRVHLADGSVVVCSTDHPWLATRYADNSRPAEWITASDLVGRYALKNLEPWVPDRSYEAGWLAGMFDGEGSLSFGTHGSPKMMIAQRVGPVAAQAEDWLRALGFKSSTIARGDTDIVNVYVNDGWPGILSALGRLRPQRLLAKLDRLDTATRCIQPWKVKVDRVEPVGVADVATITTTTGTYITAGFLHHNTYGNRMADSHDAKDRCKPCGGTGLADARDRVPCKQCRGSGLSRRNTYTHTLGRKPSPDASTTLQWGDAYRRFHEAAWRECDRVLKPGAFVFLNVKNHQRDGKEKHVAEWHLNTWLMLGAGLHHVERVRTPGNRFGQNGDARVPDELLIVLTTRSA